MKIECGRYTVNGDSYCLWINETYETKDPKTKEKTGKTREERVAGYCENFEQLLEDFVDRKTRNSDATTLKEMLKELASAEREAKKIAKTIKAARKEMADVETPNDGKRRVGGRRTKVDR